MPSWLEEVAGPNFAPAVLWTLLALVVLVIVLVVVRIVRSMTFGTFVVRERALTLSDGHDELYFCSDTCRNKYRETHRAGRTA